MSLSKLASVAAMFLVGVALMASPARGSGLTNYYAANGTEYPAVGALPGDQMYPNVSVNSSGGFVVWQDNVTDGNGWGISARKLNATFSGTLGTFRVNSQGANDQVNPRVAMLKNGGAAFVWEGGPKAHQQIFARFLSPTNTWLTTNDLVVSTFTNTWQVTPALTVLNDGNVVIVWGSYDQTATNSLLDVYGKILSPVGLTVSNAFLINQFTNYNQRTPAVAALAQGGFVVTWISEQERVAVANSASNSVAETAPSLVVPSVDVYARMYFSNGVPATTEMLVNQSGNPCAAPAVAAGSDGGFMVAWTARDMVNAANSWDIYARPFSSAGTGGTSTLVNTYTYGDQYNPQISSIGVSYLIVFTSLAQDGSREGVFSQVVNNSGTLVNNETRVNTTAVGQQMQPAVASDGVSQFEIVWTSYTGLAAGFDLYAQRYADVSSVLQPMAAPFVIAPFALSNNVYVPQLQVSWPLVLGISVSNFEVYVDGASTPTAVVTSNEWTMDASEGLANSSTHNFQVDYVTTGGLRSPISPSASGKTWSGGNYNGIPIEWLETYYGSNSSNWPANVNALLAPGGLSLYDVFLSGGNPLAPGTWLKQTWVKTSGGLYLSWNTQPGMTYQVQTSTNLTTWSNLGAARFAAGSSDSIFTGGSTADYYRVVLLRQ